MRVLLRFVGLATVLQTVFLPTLSAQEIPEGEGLTSHPLPRIRAGFDQGFSVAIDGARLSPGATFDVHVGLQIDETWAIVSQLGGQLALAGLVGMTQTLLVEATPLEYLIVSFGPSLDWGGLGQGIACTHVLCVPVPASTPPELAPGAELGIGFVVARRTAVRRMGFTVRLRAHHTYMLDHGVAQSYGVSIGFESY